jgi:hypothetical protein
MTKAICDQFAAEGQYCSGYEALRVENEALRADVARKQELLNDAEAVLRRQREERLQMEKKMLDYALAAVEAYKASLKPVAYRSRWPEVEHAKAWEYIDMFVPRPEHGRVIEPLFLLDGGDDDAA